MFLASLAWVVLLTMPAPVSTPEVAQDKPASTGRLVEITGGDDMKYSVTSISAKPGETLRIRLVSKGTLPKIAMAHNVVVLKAGAKQIDFVNAASQARATDFIPPDMKDQVLAATTLAGPGRDRGSRIQGARRRRLISLRLHVPRTLRRGDARDDRREVKKRASRSRTPDFAATPYNTKGTMLTTCTMENHRAHRVIVPFVRIARLSPGSTA